MAAASLPAQREFHAISDTIQVTLSIEPEPVPSAYKYSVGQRILANAYALTGQHKVTSRLGTGEVIFSPWDLNVR